MIGMLFSQSVTGLMKDYIRKVLLPYIGAKGQELQLANDYPALVIFDNFKAQCT